MKPDDPCESFARAAVRLCRDRKSSHSTLLLLHIPLLTAVLARLSVTQVRRYDVKEVMRSFREEEEERFRRYQRVRDEEWEGGDGGEGLPLPLLRLSPRLLLLEEEEFFAVYDVYCREQGESLLLAEELEEREEGVGREERGSDDRGDRSKRKVKKKKKRVKRLKEEKNVEKCDEEAVVSLEKAQTLEDIMSTPLSVSVKDDESSSCEWSTKTNKKIKKKVKLGMSTTSSKKGSSGSVMPSVKEDLSVPDPCNEIPNMSNAPRKDDHTEDSCDVNVCRNNVDGKVIRDKCEVSKNELNILYDSSLKLSSGVVCVNNNDGCGCSDIVHSIENVTRKRFTSREDYSNCEFCLSVVEMLARRHRDCLALLSKRHEEEISDLRENHDQAMQTSNLRLFIANSSLSREREERNSLVEAAVRAYLNEKPATSL